MNDKTKCNNFCLTLKKKQLFTTIIDNIFESIYNKIMTKIKKYQAEIWA